MCHGQPLKAKDFQFPAYNRDFPVMENYWIMVCKEKGSAWGWASKMEWLESSFSVAVACCCQVSGFRALSGLWFTSDAALKTSTPKHVKRGEKFQMLPDMFLLYLFFLWETNYVEYVRIIWCLDNCLNSHVVPLQSLLFSDIDRKSNRIKNWSWEVSCNLKQDLCC